MGNKNIMVCVTQQKTCERLILSGQELLEGKADNLYVIHVVNEDEKFLKHASDGEALEYLFDVSKKVGADLTVLKSNDVTGAIINFARQNSITHIVLGYPESAANQEESSFAIRLQAALPGAQLVQV